MLCVLLCQVTLCVTVGSSTHTWRETGQLECQVLCERLHLLGVKEHESHLLKGSSGAGKEPGRLFKLLALKDGRSTRVQGTGARACVFWICMEEVARPSLQETTLEMQTKWEEERYCAVVTATL